MAKRKAKQSRPFYLVRNDSGDIHVFSKRPSIEAFDDGDQYLFDDGETSVCEGGFQAVAGKRFLPKAPFTIVKVRLVVEA